MKKLILTCCQIAAILVLASCSKNDTTDISDTLPAETAYGVFNGINVLNYHPNQGTLEVPLFTQGNVRIVKISKNHIVANVIRRAGEHKLQIALNTKDTAFTYPFSFDIEVAYPSSLAKSGEKSSKLTVVCQDTPIAKDIYEADPANAIGKGMNLAGDFAGYNQLARVLDYGAILSSIEAGKTTNSSEIAFQISNSRYEEATVGYSAQAGISGKWPGEVKEKKLAFSGALSAQGAHETTSKSYYEYNITCILKTMMHIKMNHFENATPEFYLPYLDSMANDALNNPNSQLYKMYPNTKEGIAALAHVFGTHVMTSGVFGGRHVYIYGRKENAYQESTSAGASVSLSIKNPMGDVSDKKPLATFYINKMKQLGIDMTAEAEGYNEQIEETTGSIAIMQAIGGDACSDTEQWDASVTPANARNYALIGYDSPVADTTEEHHGGLVELTQFTVDPARKAALEEYLDDYLESQAIVQNPSKMVLADVIMYKDSNNGDGGFDPTKQTVLTSPDGKKRLYTAMVVNSNGPSDEQKHALETSKHPYIYVPDECDQYWLCALDWDSECSGITAIKISDNSESTLAKDGYERRGSCADSEMGWPAIDDNYLCVKYRPANSKDPYVTGFGIAEGDKENDIKNSNLKSSDIFATSAGTEMTQPFSIDTQFDKFWGSGLFHYSTASKSWWGNNAATKMFLYPVYTTQPLATTFKARQIILPK